DIDHLEKGAGHLAQIIERKTGCAITTVPGGGAAGGTAAGMYGLFNSPLKPGFELLSTLTSLEEKIKTADLIITALTGYGRDKDAAKKRLMQLLPGSNDPRSMFIPGSYVVGDWLKAIENADNPIEFFGRGFSIPLMKGRSWLDDF
ncbi:hypothetical protein LCGC14_1356400, partial [marine sediment metagenome]